MYYICNVYYTYVRFDNLSIFNYLFISLNDICRKVSIRNFLIDLQRRRSGTGKFGKVFECGMFIILHSL